MVLLTAASVFLVAGLAPDLRAGAEMAAASVNEGRALAALDRLVEISNSPA